LKRPTLITSHPDLASLMFKNSNTRDERFISSNEILFIKGETSFFSKWRTLENE
jgi:hypothetical protein